MRPSPLCLTPRQHCRPSAVKRKNFPTQASPGRPNRFPTSRERKRSVMNASKISKGLLLGLTLLLATSVFAANKGSLQVSDPVTVNGKQIGAGDYTVKWEGNGPNVELNILRGKNVVATVPARMVDLDRVPSRDSAVTVRQSGRPQITERDPLFGKKVCTGGRLANCPGRIGRHQQVARTKFTEGSASSPFFPGRARWNRLNPSCRYSCS